jgi:outer membrane biosynthesis protein TonB
MVKNMKNAGIVLALMLGVGLSIAQSAYCQNGRPPVVPPRPIKLVKPDCSEGNACHGLHGEVVVTVDVLTDGSVGETNPKGTNQVLMDAAENAAKQCRFTTGTFNGKPTSMNYDLRYKF